MRLHVALVALGLFATGSAHAQQDGVLQLPTADTAPVVSSQIAVPAISPPSAEMVQAPVVEAEAVPAALPTLEAEQAPTALMAEPVAQTVLPVAAVPTVDQATPAAPIVQAPATPAPAAVTEPEAAKPVDGALLEISYTAADGTVQKGMLECAIGECGIDGVEGSGFTGSFVLSKNEGRWSIRYSTSFTVPMAEHSGRTEAIETVTQSGTLAVQPGKTYKMFSSHMVDASKGGIALKSAEVLLSPKVTPPGAVVATSVTDQP